MAPFVPTKPFNGLIEYKVWLEHAEPWDGLIEWVRARTPDMRVTSSARAECSDSKYK